MGNSASISLRPPEKDQLNESVWQLYTTSGMPDVDVVFFHGLQPSDYKDAFWKTWLSRDRSVIWPKRWLGDFLRDKKQINARIFTISYDAYARKHDGQKDLNLIVEAIRIDLISGALVGQSCPVVLVGHSLGGIVIKKLLVESNIVTEGMDRTTQEAQQIETFMRNCKAVFYYSTPHTGSKVADYLDFITSRLNDPLINLLKTLNAETARINNSFANVRKRLGIKSRAIGENLPATMYKVFKAVVVPEGSARNDVDGNDYRTALSADHSDVCKPTSKKDAIFSFLSDFIIATVVEERRTKEARR